MPQIIVTLTSIRSVYLTQLRVRGTPVNASIYYHTTNGSSITYQNAAGIDVSYSLRILSYIVIMYVFVVNAEFAFII